MPSAELEDDTIHLWIADQEAIRDPALLEDYERWMTPDERERHRQFVAERHRHEYLITRALVRSTLSRYTPEGTHVRPEEWRFERTRYGRPFVIGPVTDLPHFNLSNTDGLIVCAVGREELGVDVEKLARAPSVLDVAETVFSDRELSDMYALAKAAQGRRAVELWTLKEAYIKALGTGMSTPLKKFWFTFEGGINLETTLEPAPHGWKSSLHEIGAHCIGLVAKGSRAELRVEVRDARLAIASSP